MSASASNKERISGPGSAGSKSRVGVKKERCSTEVGDRWECTLPGLGAAASAVKLDEELGVAFNSSPCAAARAMAAALSAQAAAGASAAKVSKRRSRATSKTPITVLPADTTNFRAMVQKLTGIPTSPPMQRSGFQFWGSSGPSVSTAIPFRPSHGMHGLPSLDTSAFLLSDGASSSTTKPPPNESLFQDVSSAPLVQSRHSRFDSSLAAELGLNRSTAHFTRSSFSHEVNSHLQSLLPRNSSNPGPPSCASLPSLWDPAEGENLKDKCFTDKLRDDSLNGRLEEAFVGRNRDHKQAGEADRLSVRQGSILESLLVGSDHSDLDFAGRSHNSVDSWFQNEHGAHAPKLEITRTI